MTKAINARTAVYSFSRYLSAYCAPRTPPSNTMKNNIAHNAKSRSSWGSKQSFHRKRLNEQCQRKCKPQWQYGVSHLKRCSNSEKSMSPQSGKITDGFLAGMYMTQAGEGWGWAEEVRGKQHRRSTAGKSTGAWAWVGSGWAKAPHKNMGNEGLKCRDCQTEGSECQTEEFNFLLSIVAIKGFRPWK